MMNCQEKESVGLPIGPHTSNIIADLVLSGVDKKLLENDFKFVRYIDDYHCFTENRNRAEKFLILLSDELANIRLNLNRSKTQIVKLPHEFDQTWPNKIKSYRFSKRQGSRLVFDDRNYREIVSFLDYIVALSKKETNDATLRYAIRMLAKSKFSNKAFDIFEKYIQYLIALYPYLSDFIYDIYISDDRFPTTTEFIDKLFDLSLKRKLYASLSRSIFACIRFNLRSNRIEDNINEVLATRDSISITALMVYCRKYGIDAAPMVLFSKSIVESGQTDEYWALVYELFRSDNLSRTELKEYHGYQSFKELKDGNVSFINNNLIADIS